MSTYDDLREFDLEQELQCKRDEFHDRIDLLVCSDNIKDAKYLSDHLATFLMLARMFRK